MSGRMDQVLLEWDGENALVLARSMDPHITWLCRSEVHSKLGSSIGNLSWYRYIQGEHHI